MRPAIFARPGPNAYRHYQGERATTITADVDTDVTTPLKATKEVLSHINLEKDWPGTEIIVGGEAGESRESIIRLAVAFIIALLGIYFLLVPSLYLIGRDMGRIFKRRRAREGDF